MKGYQPTWTTTEAAKRLADVLLEELRARCERKRRNDEAVAAMAAIAAEELDADTTAPDPQCGNEVEF